MSTGGIQGDVIPAVGGPAYEELICYPSSTAWSTYWGEVEDGLFLVLLMTLVSLLAQRQTPILVLLVGYITLWWYIGPILLYARCWYET